MKYHYVTHFDRIKEDYVLVTEFEDEETAKNFAERTIDGQMLHYVTFDTPVTEAWQGYGEDTLKIPIVKYAKPREFDFPTV